MIYLKRKQNVLTLIDEKWKGMSHHILEVRK